MERKEMGVNPAIHESKSDSRMGHAAGRSQHSVFRWLRYMVDDEVWHAFAHSFEFEPKLFLHRGEDRGPTIGIMRGPLAAKLKRVIVNSGEPGLVYDGRFYHRT